MIILLKLILAHLIGDFLLQPNSWVKEKEGKKTASPKMYLHALIHGALVGLLLWDWNLWPFILILMLSHLAIDMLKVYLQREHTKTAWFIIDQTMHIIVIVVFWYFWFKPDLSINWPWHSPGIWLNITALLFVTIASGVIIQVLLSGWSKQFAGAQEDSLPNAGKYIGILERLFVFLFIVTGHWEVVGFLLAAKSVFRFGDLKEAKDRKLTEYILIGTLLSFGIAIATGMAVVKISSMIK